MICAVPTKPLTPTRTATQRVLVRSDLVILAAATLAIVVAGVTRYAGGGAVLAFVCAGGAVALLAALVGRSVEQLGDRFGAGATGVLQSALGNLPELFIAFFALRQGLLVLPLLLLGVSAQAQEVEVGTSLVCDTQEQVERFVALYDGDAQSAVNSVNAAEHNPTACAVSTMAFVRGRQLATARNKDTTFQIVSILVLGVVTGDGVESVTPAPYFSVFPVDEIAI